MLGLPAYIEFYVEQLLIIVLVILASFAVLLFLIIVVHKAYVEHLDKLHKRLKVRYTTAIRAKLVRPQVQIPRPRRNIEYDTLADTLIEMLQDSSLHIFETLRRFSVELGLDEHYKKMTRSRSWIKRVMAIEKLGLLKHMELKPFFLELVKKEKDVETVARAIIALSLIVENEEDIININRLMVGDTYIMKSSKFQVSIYCNMIESLKHRRQEKVYIDFIKAILDNDDEPFTLKRDMIDACGETVLHAAREVVTDFLVFFKDSPEMKIACIRGLGKMGADNICETIMTGIIDKEWRIRVTAARYAHICTQAYEFLGSILNNLTTALYDENYYVRVNAARSLLKMGTAGHLILKKETKSLNRFTRDISNYVLEEANIRV